MVKLHVVLFSHEKFDRKLRLAARQKLPGMMVAKRGKRVCRYRVLLCYVSTTDVDVLHGYIYSLRMILVDELFVGSQLVDMRIRKVSG